GHSYTYDGMDRLATRDAVTASYPGLGTDPSSYGDEDYARTPGGHLLAGASASGAWLAGLDRHGDLSYLSEADGDVVASKVYDPFGGVLGSAGSASLSLGFQSDLTDPATGDVWMGARW